MEYGASLDLPWVKSPEASGNTGDYPTSETQKKEERKDRHCDVTENMWCHLTATVGS